MDRPLESVTLVVALALLAPGAARAAEPKPAPEAVQHVLDCMAEPSDAKRVTCYDTAAARLRDALKSGQIVALEHEAIMAARRQAFGLTLPAFDLFGRGDRPEPIVSISAKIEGVSRDRDGRLVVTLEGQGAWRQTDVRELSPLPRPGMTASVERGALGSYFMDAGGPFKMRVQRDR